MTDVSGCNWPAGELFRLFDSPGEHDPCYVVMPGGNSIPLNHDASPGVDIARAKFIVDACNRALEDNLSEVVSEAKDSAVTFVFESLAKALHLDTWTISDGSENWEGDVCGTLYGILRAAAVLDPETDVLATARASALEAEVGRLRAERDAARATAQRLRDIYSEDGVKDDELAAAVAKDVRRPVVALSLPKSSFVDPTIPAASGAEQGGEDQS